MLIRPYRGEDEAELLALWRAALPRDAVSETTFRSKVLLDPNLRTDTLPVAVVGGRVVGFVLGLTRQVPLFLREPDGEEAWITAFAVDPAFRRRGIGGALFEGLLTRLAREGRRRVSISPYLPNYLTPGIDEEAYPDTIDWLERRFGFRRIERAIGMRIDLAGFRLPDTFPAQERALAERGVRIRPVAAADLPELLPFIADRFGWDWFRHAREVLLELFGSDPQRICFLVAHADGPDGGVIGFCQQRRDRFGPFGVDPAQRGRGVGRALLLRCLAEMASLGTPEAFFLWTDARAAELYRRAGFRQDRSFAVLSLELGHDDG